MWLSLPKLLTKISNFPMPYDSGGVSELGLYVFLIKYFQVGKANLFI